MWWRIAGVVGALGVGLGAFGAHGLQRVITDPHRLEVWQTAARYHQLHALALLAVAAHPRSPAPAGWLFVAGVTLFSGSLYALTLTDLSILGAITPFGGVCLILGWLTLGLSKHVPAPS
jgi:uncharacterized membrane protein YgdD (TMEM256/DUF423 family)